MALFNLVFAPMSTLLKSPPVANNFKVGNIDIHEVKVTTVGNRKILSLCRFGFNFFYIYPCDCDSKIELSYGPRREKTFLRGFANNKGADQPAHPRSLISAFVIRLLESIISKHATSEISIF